MQIAQIAPLTEGFLPSSTEAFASWGRQGPLSFAKNSLRSCALPMLVRRPWQFPAT